MFKSRLGLFPVLFVVLLFVANGPTAVKADTVVASIAVGSTPMDVAVNPAGTRAYATNQGSNTVSVIDTSNNIRRQYRRALHPKRSDWDTRRPVGPGQSTASGEHRWSIQRHARHPGAVQRIRFL